MTLAEAEKLCIKTLKEVMEDALTTENVEICTVKTDDRKIRFKTAEEITALIQTIN